MTEAPVTQYGENSPGPNTFANDGGSTAAPAEQPDAAPAAETDSNSEAVSDYAEVEGIQSAPTQEKADDESIQAAAEQRKADYAFMNENPGSPVIRAANPNVGGESF